MIIVDIDHPTSSRPTRATLVGSCRVRNPMSDNVGRDIRPVFSSYGATHTPNEARQIIAYNSGRLVIPDFLSRFIFDQEAVPSISSKSKFIAENVDVSVVEICDSLEITYGEFFFNSNYFVRGFVRSLPGRDGLNWWREVSATGKATPNTVEAVLTAYRQFERPVPEETADLLKNVRVKLLQKADIQIALEKLTGEFDRRWLIIGPTVIPDMPGAIMEDRRRLRQAIVEVCDELSLSFQEFEQIIERHGRATVLDGNGADVNHFAPSFEPVIKNILVDWVIAAADTAAGTWKERPSVGLGRRVNEMMRVVHEPRTRDLGVNESGLGAHYAFLLERGDVFGAREQSALELVLDELPAHDHYAILQAGLGQLAFALAMAGKRVTAYDIYPARRAAISAGVDFLVAQGIVPPGLIDVGEGFPVDRPEAGTAIAIGLEMALNCNESRQQEIIQNLSALDTVLIEPRSFLKMREPGPEQELVTAAFREQGMVEQMTLNPNLVQYNKLVRARPLDEATSG